MSEEYAYGMWVIAAFNVGLFLMIIGFLIQWPTILTVVMTPVLFAAYSKLTRRVFGKLLPYLLRDVPREVAEDLVQHTWRSSTSSLWEVIYRHKLDADIERLPSETGVLCIHGDQDVMAPLSAIEHCVLNRANWDLAVLPGVDHHPFLRETGKCLNLIRATAIKSIDCRGPVFDR